MTAIEVLNIVRTLLDSGREWYVSLPVVEHYINEAQLKVLRQYIILGEERPIFPLFTVVTFTVDNPKELSPYYKYDVNQVILEPRHCVLSLYDTRQPFLMGKMYSRVLPYIHFDKL